MKILSIDSQNVEAGTFSTDDNVPSFQVTNGDETLEQALAWVSVQETMDLRSGGQEGNQFYSNIEQVRPGEPGYFDAVSEFLYDYGYYLDLTAEAVES